MVDGGRIAPTVFRRKTDSEIEIEQIPEDRLAISDGMSVVSLTRRGFFSGEDLRIERRGPNDDPTRFHAFRVVDSPVETRRFELSAGEAATFEVEFDLGPGEFQVVVGYDDGRRVAMSNSVEIDIE